MKHSTTVSAAAYLNHHTQALIRNVRFIIMGEASGITTATHAARKWLFEKCNLFTVLSNSYCSIASVPKVIKPIIQGNQHNLSNIRQWVDRCRWYTSQTLVMYFADTLLLSTTRVYTLNNNNNNSTSSTWRAWHPVGNRKSDMNTDCYFTVRFFLYFCFPCSTFVAPLYYLVRLFIWIGYVLLFSWTLPLLSLWLAVECSGKWYSVAKK